MKIKKTGPNNINITNEDDSCISFEIKCFLRDAEKTNDGWIFTIENKKFSNFIKILNENPEFKQLQCKLRRLHNDIVIIKILSNGKYSRLINKTIYINAIISSIYQDSDNYKKNIIICKNANIRDVYEEFEEDMINVIDFKNDINKYFKLINDTKEELDTIENILKDLLTDFDLNIFNDIQKRMQTYKN